MEKEHREQRYAIKFCVKLGERATYTCEKIQKAFGNDSLILYHVLKYGGTKTL
jgi:hypothetical protein